MQVGQAGPSGCEGGGAPVCQAEGGQAAAPKLHVVTTRARRRGRQGRRRQAPGAWMQGRALQGPRACGRRGKTADPAEAASQQKGALVGAPPGWETAKAGGLGPFLAAPD